MASKLLDVQATTNNNDLYAARLVVDVTVLPTGTTVSPALDALIITPGTPTIVIKARAFITTGTTWAGALTDGSDITVECIGGGGGGSSSNGSDICTGAGGGAYATKVVPYVSGTPIPVQIGAGGAGGTTASPNGGDGTDTIWNTSVVIAKAGKGGNAVTLVPGAGGVAASCTPSTGAFSGGSGGGVSGDMFAGGGGGGAAGPKGGGKKGGDAGDGGGGGGGGGAGGGLSTAGGAGDPDPSKIIGGAGGLGQDGTAGGVGGNANPDPGTPSGAGSRGSGSGGAAYSKPALAGGNGIEWGTAGAGGGGGAGAGGGAGGLYGGGGGGANWAQAPPGGQGAQGVIVITYVPGTPPTICTPAARVLTITAATPTIRITLKPASAALTITKLTPALRLTVKPTTKALVITKLTPTLKSTVVLSPGPRALVITPGTPLARISIVFAPAKQSLVLTAASPAVTKTDNITLAPAKATLTFAPQTPALKLIVRIGPATKALAITPATPTVTIAGVPSSAFSYYRSVSFDRSKCGASNLSSFPVLVSIVDATFGSRVTSSSGYDIVFSTDNAGTSQVPWEIEYFDKTTGTLIAWVNIATLNGSAAATNSSIFMCYGAGAITTAQNTGPNAPAQVWANGYVGVWHLPNGTTLTANDSTATGASGTITGVTVAAGKIGGGGSFTDTSVIDVGASSAFAFDRTSTFTLSCWAKIDSSFTSEVILMAKMANQLPYTGWTFDWGFGSQPVAQVYLISDYNTGNYISVNSSGPNISFNVWHYLVVTFGGAGATSLKHYCDGAVQTVSIVVNALTGSLTNSVNTTLGRRSPPATGGMVGGGDEFRIANVVRTPDWIFTEYNSQNAPGNIGADPGSGGFVIYGPETAAPAGGPRPVSATLAIVPGTPAVIVTIATTLNPAARALTITPGTPVLKTITVYKPGTRALVITGGTPTLRTTTVYRPSATALTITPGTPTLKTITVYKPSTRALVITAGTPVLRTITVYTPASRALVITAGTPVLKTISVYKPGAAVLTFTGIAPTFRAIIRPTAAALIISPRTPVFGNIPRPLKATLVITPGTPTLRFVGIAQQVVTIA